MFRLAYILVITIAQLVLPMVAVFSKKIRLFLTLRKQSAKPESSEIQYWIHCASLGEYEMAIPLIQKLILSKKCSLDSILISLFSPSGYSQAIKGDYASRIMYLPLDSISEVKNFYQTYNPQKAIFIRYDFWYNYLNEGVKRGVRFYLVNGRFGDSHFFFKWYGKPYLNLIKQFANVFVSDEKSKVTLELNGVNATYTGDTRFDRVEEIYQSNMRKHQEIDKFKGSRKLLIVGSSWQPEEDIVKQLLDTDPKNLAILIAPHDINRASTIAKQFEKYNPKKYSNNDFTDTDRILILDTIGMLSCLYQYAEFSLIGGGFSGKLHNILEPLVQGSFPCFGPEILKFPEAVQARDEECAFTIDDVSAWTSLIHTDIADDKKLKGLKMKCRMYSSKHRGATQVVFANIG